MTKKKIPNIDLVAASEEATAQNEEAGMLLEHIEKMEITNTPELKFAVSAVAEMKEKHAVVDEQRRRFTDAAQAIIDEANALFKPALKSLSQCEKLLKGKMVEFDIYRIGNRDTLIESAGTLAAQGDKKTAEECLAAADGYLPPKIPGMSMSRTVKIEVNDAVAAVAWCIENDRTEFLQLNEKAVKAFAKATDGRGIEIPGITIKPTASVSITVSKVERI